MPSRPSQSTSPTSSSGSVITSSATASRWSIGELLSAIGVDAPPSLLETEHGQLIVLRRAWRLTVSQSNLATEREVLCAELNRRAKLLLTPATREQLTIRVRSLLAHYFRSDDQLTVQVLMLDDWISALEGAPMWSVDGACKEWLSGPDTARVKPLPADIKARLRHGPPAYTDCPKYRSFDTNRSFSKSCGNSARDAQLDRESYEMLAALRSRAREDREPKSAWTPNFFPYGSQGPKAIAAVLSGDAERNGGHTPTHHNEAQDQNEWQLPDRE